jgi:ADP-ribosyl-[dinitrogen reductase] hydrolase
MIILTGGETIDNPEMEKQITRSGGLHAMGQIREASIAGCILGTAVGDALGLPGEGLSPSRLNRLFPRAGHHFIFGRGMVSDDTEHTCMVAQAFIASAGRKDRFTGELARQLKWWLLLLPAGTGFATLRAGIRLWLGFPPSSSGVFSAGNGPAMRSAILGVLCGDEPDHLRELVRASSLLTHSDPKAFYGALAVATAASVATRHQGDILPREFGMHLRTILGEEGQEFFELMDRILESVSRGEAAEVFAAGLGLKKGISGYVYHTVPMALHVWLRNQHDYASALNEIVGCGGDTDTTAAIVGGITGARVGREGIPVQWIAGLWEWPRSLQWMEALAMRLHRVVESGEISAPLQLNPFTLLLRNIFFLLVVLIHGFRRLLPPY